MDIKLCWTSTGEKLEPYHPGRWPIDVVEKMNGFHHSTKEEITDAAAYIAELEEKNSQLMDELGNL